MQGTQFLDILMGLADKNTDDTSYRSKLLDWTNLVLKDIQNRQQNFHWRWCEKTATASTVADQHTYDMPTDVDTNKALYLYERTNDISFKFIPYQKFVRTITNPANDTGTSYLWTFFANSLRLWPTPAAVVTFYLDYVKLITALADDTNTTDIPAKYDPIVIDGVLVYIYKYDPELGDWAKQQLAYEAGITRMISDNGQSPSEIVRPTSHRSKYRGVGLFPHDNVNI